MVKSLIVDYCLRQAQEYLELATAASDPDLRNQYTRVAQNLTERATDLAAERSLVDKIHSAPHPAATIRRSAPAEPIRQSLPHSD